MNKEKFTTLEMIEIRDALIDREKMLAEKIEKFPTSYYLQAQMRDTKTALAKWSFVDRASSII